MCNFAPDSFEDFSRIFLLEMFGIFLEYLQQNFLCMTLLVVATLLQTTQGNA